MNEEWLAEVVDTKLSRNELVQLILNDIREEIEARLKGAETEREALQEVDLTPALETMPKRPSMEIHVHWKDEERYFVKASWSIPKGRLPAPIRAAWDAKEAADKKVDSIKDDLNVLESKGKKFHLEIVRRTLKGTAAGQKVLGLIEDMQGSMRKKLLARGKS